MEEKAPAAEVPESAVLTATAASEATEAMVTAPQKAMADTRTLLFERRPWEAGLESLGLHMMIRSGVFWRKKKWKNERLRGNAAAQTAQRPAE